MKRNMKARTLAALERERERERERESYSLNDRNIKLE